MTLHTSSWLCCRRSSKTQRPKAPALRHSQSDLFLLRAPHTPASLECFSREIQIIFLQGFEPIESHKVMRLLEAGLLVLGGGRRAMSSIPPSLYWSLGVCLSVESGWRVAGTSGSDVWEEDPDSIGRQDLLCHPVFSSQPSCPFLHCFLGWEIGGNGF